MPSPLLHPDERFSALIFDCDGTLIDTLRAHFIAFNRALAEEGLAMEPAWYRIRTGLTPLAILDALAAETGRDFDRRKVLIGYAEHYQAASSDLQEIREVAEVARRFRGQVPMAVASNGTRGNVERSLYVAGLASLFDEIVTIEDVAHGKPAPDIYLESARRLAVSPDGCIVFEDTDQGLQAARNAGMRARDVRLHVTLDWD